MVQSSFLRRLNSNSLPSLKKKGGGNTKSFVFGRDDSNSRSAISASESFSDMVIFLIFLHITI